MASITDSLKKVTKTISKTLEPKKEETEKGPSTQDQGKTDKPQEKK